MKKISFIVVVVFMVVLTLAACTASPAVSGSASSDSSIASTAASTEAATPSASASTSASATVSVSGKMGLKIALIDFLNDASHQTMDKHFADTCEYLKSIGKISEYTIVCSNQDSNQEITLIQNFIMKGVDGIVLDPYSPTADVGAIEKAKAAGIPVLVINDGPAATKDCYELENDFYALTKSLAEYQVERLNGKGNVLMGRGTAGAQADAVLYAGAHDVFLKYPDIKIVGEEYGSWTKATALQSIAQILPSLPQVDAFMGQGGDEYAAVLAFQAAGRSVPLICGFNRGDFLNWWSKNPDYETISSCPDEVALSSSAPYVLCDIIDGVKMPRYLSMPPLTITKDTLSQFLPISDDALAGSPVDWDYVRNTLEAQPDTGK